MNFLELVGNVKNRFLSLDKKNQIIISVLVLIILLSLILIVITTTNKKDSIEDVYPLVLKKELQIPPSAELPKDYNISRTTKDKWTDSEAEQWFTPPSEKEIENLSNSNDKIINSIIEAAPWKNFFVI